jgi:hypothetical protein
MSLVVKNFISGIAGMGLLIILFIFLWGSWLLIGLFLVGFFVFDALTMVSLHRRNLRRMNLARASDGERSSSLPSGAG